MTRIAVYFLIGYFFILVQTVLLPHLLPFQIKADLLLILVIYLGLNEHYLGGALLCYALGSLFDVFAGSQPGLFGIALMTTFLVVRTVVGRLNTESSVLLLLMVFCGTLFEGVLIVFLLGTFADTGPMGFMVLGGLLPQALLNLAVAFVLLRCLVRLQRRFFPRSLIPGLQHLGSRHGS